MNEIWKPCFGFEDYLEASSEGRIRSKRRVFVNALGRTCVRNERILCHNINKGYHRVFIRINHKGYNFLVHRLVFEAFNGKIPDGLQVNHIDENKDNNKLSNLNLLTPGENSRWGTRLDKFRKQVKQKDIYTGEVIKTYSSISEASEQTGICFYNISSCCLGKHNSAGGYLWEFA